MSKLKIICINVNSIIKIDRRYNLNDFLKNNEPDIALLSETKLNKFHKPTFKNYKIIRSDRENKKGGGCAILIKEKYNYQTFTINNLKYLEVTGIVITGAVSKNKIHIFSAYNKSGRVNYSADLNTIMQLVGNNPIVLGGDLNSRDPEFGDKYTNTSGRRLYQWLTNEGLKYNVSQVPTYRPTREDSYLDFFLVSNSLNIEFDKLHPYFLKTIDYESDHKAVEIILTDQAISRSQPIVLNDFSNTNLLKFHQIINQKVEENQLNPNRNLSNDEITEAAIDISKILEEAMEKAVPKITLRERGMIPLPDNILNLIAEKKRIRRRFHRTQNPIFRAQIKNITKIISDQIQWHHIKHWENTFNNIKMNNDTFKKLKNLAGVKRNFNIPFLQDGNVVYDQPEQIVNILANQFEAVHRQNQSLGNHQQNEIVNKIIPTIANKPQIFQFTSKFNSLKSQTEDQNNVHNSFMNVNELEIILKSRNNKKSAGNDQIPMYLLKKIPLLMKKQIVILFNNMFNNAFIPITWKQAKICAILKPSKKPMSPTSYRPISLISNISKLYEVFVQRKIVDHLEENKTLNPNQFGFRRGYSVNHALTIFNSDVANNLNNKSGTIAVGIDTEKAFDTTWQNGIIYKMKEKFKFPDHLCKIVHNYLQDRTFYVEVNKSKSCVKQIAEGVPQGSILGPTLFNIFLADLPNPQGITKTLVYADDILVYASHPILSKAMKAVNDYLLEYHEFTNNWKIKTNIQKCETIKITNSDCYKNNKKLKVEIKLGNSEINNVNTIKYLGLNISKNFKFKNHIKITINKCKKAIGMFFKILSRKSKLDNKIKIIFYKQIIRSIISHAFPTWFNINPLDMEIIRKYERKCLRLCTGLHKEFKNNTYKTISNKKLYETAKIIRVDNFLTKVTINFWNSLNNIKENVLIEKLKNSNVSLKDRNYNLKHISLLNKEKLLYNTKEEIIYYNGKFDKSQYVKVIKKCKNK